jgi:hypothetical protein
MKTTILALAVAFSAIASAQQPAGRKQMRDAATHDSIVEAGRKAAEANKDKQPLFTPPSPEREAVKPKPKSLLASAEIICYNGLATLVPKRALVHMPKTMSDRLGMKEGAKFVSFQDFMSANRAWITSTPVSRRQAEGREPMAEALIKSFAKETRVVVATLQEAPVSVLPLKETETPTAATP